MSSIFECSLEEKVSSSLTSYFDKDKDSERLPNLEQLDSLIYGSAFSSELQTAIRTDNKTPTVLLPSDHDIGYSF